jgi:hypothetical protein
MKKVFLMTAIIAVTALAPRVSNAQLEAGKFFIGGLFELSSESNAEKNESGTTTLPGETKVGIHPDFGYMLNSKWALMVGVGYTTSLTSEGTGDDKTDYAYPCFIFNPGVRHFLFSERGGLFIDGELEFRLPSEQEKTGNKVTSLSALGIYAGVGLGAAFFISDHVMLTGKFGSIGFDSFTKNESKDEKRQTNTLLFGINTRDIGLGVSYFF